MVGSVPPGKTWWRRILASQVSCAGKEKLLALGVYPEVTLADALQNLKKLKEVSLGESI